MGFFLLLQTYSIKKNVQLTSSTRLKTGQNRQVIVQCCAFTFKDLLLKICMQLLTTELDWLSVLKGMKRFKKYLKGNVDSKEVGEQGSVVCTFKGSSKRMAPCYITYD